MEFLGGLGRLLKPLEPAHRPQLLLQLNFQQFVSHGNLVTDLELASASGFEFSIDGDVSLLDQLFCLPSASNDLCQLEKLVEANRCQVLVSLIVWIIHAGFVVSVLLLGFERCYERIMVTDIAFLLRNFVVDITMLDIRFLAAHDQVFFTANRIKNEIPFLTFILS